MEELKEEKPRTLCDIVKQEGYETGELKKCMYMLIAHDFKAPFRLLFCDYWFEIKLLEKRKL